MAAKSFPQWGIHKNRSADTVYVFIPLGLLVCLRLKCDVCALTLSISYGGICENRSYSLSNRVTCSLRIHNLLFKQGVYLNLVSLYVYTSCLQLLPDEVSRRYKFVLPHPSFTRNQHKNSPELLLLNFLPSNYTITASSLRAWLQLARLAAKNNDS